MSVPLFYVVASKSSNMQLPQKSELSLKTLTEPCKPFEVADVVANIVVHAVADLL